MLEVPFDDVNYEHNEGRWVVWDNDPAKAAEVKRLHPYDPVYLYDRDTGKYTQYKIEIIHRKPHMKNGKLIYEKEIIEI